MHPALRASLLLSSDPPCASNAESHLIPNEDWGAWLDRTTTLLPGQPVTLEHLAPGVYRVEVQNLPESCAQVGNALLDLTNGPLRQPLTISISRKGSP